MVVDRFGHVRGIDCVGVIEAGDGPLTVAHLVPGSFFGELSLLTGEPRGATVTARGDRAV